MGLTQRDMVKLSLAIAAATALRPLPKLFAHSAVISNPISSSGERISVLGVGSRDYFSDPPELRAELKELLRRLPQLGRSLIDTATGYQQRESETVIGNLVSELGNRNRLFFATKVNASGKQEACPRSSSPSAAPHKPHRFACGAQSPRRRDATANTA